jgi:hypothetical protein
LSFTARGRLSVFPRLRGLIVYGVIYAIYPAYLPIIGQIYATIY